MRRTLVLLFLGSLIIAGAILHIRQQALQGKIKLQGPIGLEVSGNQDVVIDSAQTFTGDIEIRDDAILTIKNAVIRVEPIPGKLTAQVRVLGNAKLILQNAAIVPMSQNPESLEVFARHMAKIKIRNGVLLRTIHLQDKADLDADGLTLSSQIGPVHLNPEEGTYGNLELSGQSTALVQNSTLGGISLTFGPNEGGDIRNLRTAKAIDINFRRDLPKFTGKFNLALKNTRILPAGVGHQDGGWTITADPKSRLTISDSVLSRFVIGPFINEKLTFDKFPVKVPLNLDYRLISLKNTTVEGEWGFMGKGCTFLFKNMEALWLLPSGEGTWTAQNSTITQLDLNNFHGTLALDGSKWVGGGKFINDTDVILRGITLIDPGVRDRFILDDSVVRREYPIRAATQVPKTSPISFQVFDGQTLLSERTGTYEKVLIPVTFNDDNYDKTMNAQVNMGGRTAVGEIRLLSSTPILLKWRGGQ